MKKMQWVFMGLISVILAFGAVIYISSCAAVENLGDLVIVGGSSSSSGGGGGAIPSDILKVYCDRSEGSLIQIVPAWEVWPDGMSCELKGIVGDGNDGGANCVEVTNTYSRTWYGFAIYSQSGSLDLTGYNFLVVSFKVPSNYGFTGIDVGVGRPNSVGGPESWHAITVTKDNTWHRYVIDLTGLSCITNMSWVFALRNTGSGTWTGGSFRFDEVYYTKTTNHLTN